MSTLDQIIKGEEPASVEETPVETSESIPEAENTETQEAGEALQGEISETPSEDNQTKSVDIEALQSEMESLRKESGGLKAALSAERKKRQEAASKEPEQDFFDDPNKYLAESETRFDAKLANVRIEMSEQFARQKYEDFGDKMELFGRLAEEDPTLVAKMRGHQNPAEYAYVEADKHHKLSEFGDMKSYEDKIRGEERLKFEAEINTRVDAEVAKRQDLPGTLSNVQSAGTGNGKKDYSLKGILGR